MIIFTVTINVLQDRQKELIQTVRSLSKAVSSEKGFVDQGMYRNLEDENSILMVEQWETKDDLDEHLRSHSFGVLMGALNVLAVSWDVRFNMVSHSVGEEAILAARET